MDGVYQDSKRNSILFLGCFFAYALSSLTKSNYTASVAYVVSQGMFSKADAGLIASAFYIFYGIGQAFGGIAVDKVSPYKMIRVGIIGALICNLILCFTYEFEIVLVVWSISGIIQMGIWPGVCKILSTDIAPEFRSKGSVYISYGLPASTLLSYLLSATILEKLGWSAMFLSSVVAMVITLVFWIYATGKRPEKPVSMIAPEETKKQFKPAHIKFLPLLFVSGMFLMLFINFNHSMLSTGAQVWIPTMIMENYTVSSAVASMQSIFLVSMQIAGLLLLGAVIRKIKSPILGIGLSFALCIIPFTVLMFIGKIPLILALLMLALYKMISSSNGVFITQMSVQLGRFGYSGTYSGMANACASFGVVVASGTYGIIADKFGWSAITAIWLILSVMSVLCCVPAFYMWKKLIKKEDEKLIAQK